MEISLYKANFFPHLVMVVLGYYALGNDIKFVTGFKKDFELWGGVSSYLISVFVAAEIGMRVGTLVQLRSRALR